VLDDTDEENVLQELTELQEKVLDYIEDCVTNGLPPTRAEIAHHFDIWPNSADEVVRALAKKERITLIQNVSRGIKLVSA
jgi:SOS-response transcriptional repressor LexA